MKINYIFIYGSLKRGCNNNYLNKLEFVDNCITKNKFRLINGKHFPYLLNKKGKFNIKGELYKINNEIDLIEIDKFEGHPTYFKRETIEVILNNGKNINCYVYFYQDLSQSGEEISEYIENQCNIIDFDKYYNYIMNIHNIV